MRTFMVAAALLLAAGALPAWAQKAGAADGLVAAVAPVAAPAAAPAPAQPAPATAPAPRRNAPRAASAGDGPASVLNGFVLKEVTQCRPLPVHERRACCERLLHPNACVE